MPEPVIDRSQVDELTDKKLVDAALGEVNAGATAVKDFTDAKVYRTKTVVAVYQPESKGGLKSKLWSPYEPEQKPLMRADIPKGTTVVIGVLAKTTQWYIPDTFGAKGSRPNTPPMTWKCRIIK